MTRDNLLDQGGTQRIMPTITIGNSSSGEGQYVAL